MASSPLLTGQWFDPRFLPVQRHFFLLLLLIFALSLSKVELNLSLTRSGPSGGGPSRQVWLFPAAISGSPFSGAHSLTCL